MSRKKRLFSLLFLMIVGLLYPLSTPAEQKGTNILFIFDASGSMHQKIEGKSKLKTAKEVLSALVGDLPADANIGLEAYGHRVPGTEKNESCQDIETLVSVKGENSKIIIKKLNSLDAKGMTPISASLEKSADVLRGLTGKKTIILISDGEETCGGDPVGVAGKIREEFGVDVVIHVIGFDVKEKEKMQLAGIAKAGGGKYYFADNAEQLKDSLVQIRKEVVKEKVVRKKESKVIFREDFNDEFLSDAWDVINADSDSMIIEDGHMTIVLEPGPKDDIARNIVLYSKKLPKSYDVYVKFKAEVVDFPNFRAWETQRSGLVFYSDKKNYMLLTTSSGGVSRGNPLIAVFDKLRKGEWLSGLNQVMAKSNGPATYEFKIKKKKHKYTAYFKNQKGKWMEIGSFVDLKGKFKPGFLTWRTPKARETATDFDSFVITSLE